MSRQTSKNSEQRGTLVYENGVYERVGKAFCYYAGLGGSSDNELCELLKLDALPETTPGRTALIAFNGSGLQVEFEPKGDIGEWSGPYRLEYARIPEGGLPMVIIGDDDISKERDRLMAEEMGLDTYTHAARFYAPGTKLPNGEVA